MMMRFRRIVMGYGGGLRSHFQVVRAMSSKAPPNESDPAFDLAKAKAEERRLKGLENAQFRVMKTQYDSLAKTITEGGSASLIWRSNKRLVAASKRCVNHIDAAFKETCEITDKEYLLDELRNRLDQINLDLKTSGKFVNAKEGYMITLLVNLLVSKKKNENAEIAKFIPKGDGLFHVEAFTSFRNAERAAKFEKQDPKEMDDPKDTFLAVSINFKVYIVKTKRVNICPPCFHLQE